MTLQPLRVSEVMNSSVVGPQFAQLERLIDAIANSIIISDLIGYNELPMPNTT
jgi:hypothetical protein